VFFHTSSHNIQSYLHRALSCHAATRAVLALSLTGGGIQKVKTIAAAVTDKIQINCCKANSDSRKQPLFLIKAKAAIKVENAQKGCTRQLLLG